MNNNDKAKQLLAKADLMKKRSGCNNGSTPSRHMQVKRMMEGRADALEVKARGMMTEEKTMICLQNTITGKFYARGVWNATFGGAEEIEKDSAKYHVIKYTWDTSSVVEVGAHEGPACVRCVRCGDALNSPEGLETGVCCDCWTPDDNWDIEVFACNA